MFDFHLKKIKSLNNKYLFILLNYFQLSIQKKMLKCIHVYLSNLMSFKFSSFSYDKTNIIL